MTSIYVVLRCTVDVSVDVVADRVCGSECNMDWIDSSLCSNVAVYRWKLQPQKWKTISKMKDDLENGRLLQKWKTTSKVKNDLKNQKRAQKWKMT